MMLGSFSLFEGRKIVVVVEAVELVGNP